MDVDGSSVTFKGKTFVDGERVASITKFGVQMICKCRENFSRNHN